MKLFIVTRDFWYEEGKELVKGMVLGADSISDLPRPWGFYSSPEREEVYEEFKIDTSLIF